MAPADPWLPETGPDEPRPTQRLFTPPVLDRLSVDELKLYIATLQAEILRVEEAVAAKEAHRRAMDRLFKPAGGEG